MTEDDFRALALSQPEAEEAPHFEATSFRVRGKIFLTFGEGRGDKQAVFKLPPHIQEAVVEANPAAVEPATGYWGRQGWTRVDIGRLEDKELAELVCLAWRQVAPKKLQAELGRVSEAP